AEDMCVSGKCLSFDGINDRVDIGASEKFNFTKSSPFTVSTWARTLDEVGANEQYIVSRFDLAGDIGGYVLFIKGDTVFFDLIENTGLQHYITAKLPSAKDWHHLVGVYDGSGNRNGIALYIDGKLVAKSTPGVLGEISTDNQL